VTQAAQANDSHFLAFLNIPVAHRGIRGDSCAEQWRRGSEINLRGLIGQIKGFGQSPS